MVSVMLETNMFCWYLYLNTDDLKALFPNLFLFLASSWHHRHIEPHHHIPQSNLKSACSFPSTLNPTPNVENPLGPQLQLQARLTHSDKLHFLPKNLLALMMGSVAQAWRAKPLSSQEGKVSLQPVLGLKEGSEEESRSRRKEWAKEA